MFQFGREVLHDVLLFNVFWPLNRYRMRTLHQPSFQMAHLTLKSLERYCPNKKHLYDMVTNVKFIVLNFELILIIFKSRVKNFFSVSEAE